MLLLLPVAVFAFTFGYYRRLGSGWRASLLSSCLLVTMGVAISTELLSLFHLVTVSVVSGLWLVAAFVAAWCFLRQANSQNPERGEVSRLWWAVAIVAIPLGLVGMVWPPTNFDSLVYHLPRLFHWIQNGSVDHFQTSIFRQLYQPPLLEYLLLHAKLLGAGEWVFSLLPVAILFVAGIAASLVTEELLPGSRGGALACFLVVSHPVAVMQATNPKNDILLEAVLLLWLWFYFRFSKKPTVALWGALLISGALLILTKGTSWIFAPALAVILGLELRKSLVRNLIISPFGIAAAVIALSLVVPHHLRNLKTFGSPLGPRAGQGEILYGNEEANLSVLASNAYRNLAIELKSPLNLLNSALQRGGVLLHREVGRDLNDPATTWPGTTFDVAGAWDFNEDTLPNPFGTLFVGLALVGAIFMKNVPQGRLLSGILLSAALLFALLLKWQPWHPRLHIPLYGIGYVLVALCLVNIRSFYLDASIVFVCAISALVCLWSHPARPLGNLDLTLDMSRNERFERLGAKYLADMEATFAFLEKKNAREVCLVTSGNEWEYPLWRLSEVRRNTWKWTSRQGRGTPEVGAMDSGTFVLQIRGAPVDPATEKRLAVPALLENEFFRLFQILPASAPP